MTLYIVLAGTILAAGASLLFSSLTYSLRDYSRAVLDDYLERHGRQDRLDSIVDQTPELIFITAVFRLLSNLLLLIFILRGFHETEWPLAMQYLAAVAVTAVVSLVVSVALPTAIANHIGEAMIGFFHRPLQGVRLVLKPFTHIMHATDRIVARAAGQREGENGEQEEEQVQEEILSAVEEGEKKGVVDEQEREMIESVIQFRDRQAGQIMTPRPQIIAIERNASLSEVKELLEQSGHSRIPVYDGTLDKIVGVLYARDMLKHIGLPAEQFDIRSAMRKAYYVPETKPLRDLLRDFRLQKVHIAIVLDEYGGTAGLVTIEDILEELVGEISDEHEPQEPAQLKRISDSAWEADAKLYVEELNRVVGLNIPEDEGYDTLGGFVSTTLGRIPAPGTTFEGNGVKYTILEAEAQRVNRVRIELPTGSDNGAAA
jgi:putative hemolysin